MAQGSHHSTQACRRPSVHAGAQKLGLETGSEPFFDTVRIKSGSSKDLVQRALDEGINLRKLDDETVTVSFDEVTTTADVDQLLAILNGGSKPDFSAASLASEVGPVLHVSGRV